MTLNLRSSVSPPSDLPSKPRYKPPPVGDEAVKGDRAPTSETLLARFWRCLAGTDMPERYLAATRSTQLEETLQLVKYSAVTHIVVAIAFIYLFWTTPQRIYSLALLVAVVIPSSSAIAAAQLWWRKSASTRSVEYGLRLAAFLSCLIGAAWATMPIALFTTSDTDHKLIVVGTTIGLIADVYALGPTLLVCMAYVVPLIIGGFIGINIEGSASGFQLSLLLIVYAVFVVFSCKGMSRLSVQRIVDRVKISEQSDTIGLLLRDFEEGSSDWLWDINEHGRFQHVSERVAQAAGLTIQALDDMVFVAMFQNQNRRGALSTGAQEVLAAVAARRSFHDQIVEIETSGSNLYWKLSGKPIYDKGRFAGYRGVGSDITAARNAEARIAFMAHHDELTGLANRASFLKAARAACVEVLTKQTTRALLYLDLDGFKTVNDSYGHAFGDVLLSTVSKRLEGCIPAKAVVGRLGGDEFAILVSLSNDDEAEHLAREIIDVIGMPFEILGSRVTIGVSIGIAFSPKDSSEPDGLLVKADLALYRAKLEGRGRHRMFVEAYETSINEQRALENDLRLALARGEFELKYQPLVSLIDGHIVCFETLIRWTCGKRGPVPPSEFIPVAESIGLIVMIGRWVLLRACRTATTWDKEIAVAVNISPQHFKRPDFLSDVMVALETTGLHPSRLEIEITEGVFLDNSAIAIDNLHALRRRGIRIALDDFGTGFSSLNYLVNFPVDKIKIDRSFVTHITSRHENRAIVNAILALAKDLSIKVTAEGVETMEQATALKLRQCDDIQGFLISPAVAPSSIPALIDAVPWLSEITTPRSVSSLALAISR